MASSRVPGEPGIGLMAGGKPPRTLAVPGAGSMPPDGGVPRPGCGPPQNHLAHGLRIMRPGRPAACVSWRPAPPGLSGSALPRPAPRHLRAACGLCLATWHTSFCICLHDFALHIDCLSRDARTLPGPRRTLPAEAWRRPPGAAGRSRCGASPPLFAPFRKNLRIPERGFSVYILAAEGKGAPENPPETARPTPSGLIS